MRFLSTVVKNQHGTEFVNLIKVNERMFKFYGLLGLDTPEWRTGLRRPLNQSFRINSARGGVEVARLRTEAERFIRIHGGRRLNENVFQLGVDRWGVNRNPELKRFLNEEDRLGNLARQEGAVHSNFLKKKFNSKISIQSLSLMGKFL